jgi:hypothetical protein
MVQPASLYWKGEVDSEQILIEVAEGAMDSYSSSVQGTCATQTVSEAKTTEMASQTWSTAIKRESICDS